MRDGPFSFDEILDAELNEVQKSREARGVAQPAPGQRGQQRSNAMNLLGLAFSGGGIRSATFNLGVLQTLAGFGLLKRVDYLSTVSGGGYIGGWLTAWLKRSTLADVECKLPSRSGPSRTKDHIRRCEPKTRPQPVASKPVVSPPRDVMQIRHLREYSNFLTPRTGFFSEDTWAAISIYVRNVLLNLSVLVLTLGAIILLLRSVHVAHEDLIWTLSVPASWQVWLLLSLSWLCAALFAFFGPSGRISLRGRPAVYLGIVVPTFLSAWVYGALVLGANGAWGPHPGVVLFAAGALVFLVGLFPGAAPLPPLAEAWRLVREHAGVNRSRVIWLVAVAVGAAVAGWILASGTEGLAGGLVSAGDSVFARLAFLDDAQGRTIWTVPVAVGLFSLGGSIYIGVMGPLLPTARREWWGRLGGVLLALSGAWVVLFLIVLGSTRLVENLGSLLPGLQLSWIATTVGGILAGRQSNTTGEETPSGAGSRGLALVATLAPYVFAIGTLITLSYAVDVHLVRRFALDSWPALACVALMLLGLAFWLASRISINEFSMHNFYRNRLARCYQGAYEGRKGHPFTGFADRDHEIAFSNLLIDPLPTAQQAAIAEQPSISTRPYQGPYHIVNAALNLTGGKKLAWQKRKATSFVFTPKFCGFETHDPDSDAPLPGYRPSVDYAGGIRMSDAVAVSGAAAAPNMGYHSSAPLAFLMTLFNVRLGLWLGNPHRTAWRSPAPPLSLGYLLAELFGTANAERDFVYLSDGGHFENLGIYELVRRRCRFIIACDGEADPSFQFDGLGNAIEKCRTDLGTEIDIDVEAIRKAGMGEDGAQHCVTGVITYPDGLEPGTLLYLKASTTGDEQTDVRRYKSQHPAFPHQTTGDQWFDETQFESYRTLGEHVMTEALRVVDQSESVSRTPTERLFELLDHQWHPPSPHSAAAFSRHGAQFNSLMRQLSRNARLAFLDTQLNPSWKLAHTGRPLVDADMDLPDDEQMQREAYLFCRQLLQLMENVYVDLHLENEHGHPDNQGWMNLFRNWSWSSMLRVTWATTASTYGARFREFCRRELQLELGTVVVGNPIENLANDHTLNFVEQRLAEDARQRYTERVKSEPVIQPVLLSVTVPMLEKPVRKLAIGFLVASDQTLVYVRVQDHLRTMGLGEQTIRAFRQKILRDKTVLAPPDVFNWFSEGDQAVMSVDEQTVLITNQQAKRFERMFRRTSSAQLDDVAEASQ